MNRLRKRSFSLHALLGEGLILLGPGAEALQESLLVDGEFVLALGQLAVRDGKQVVLMRGDVELDEAGTVALGVGVALADLDLAGEVVDLGGLAVGQPVLGSGVAVAEDDGGQTGDRVNGVSETVLGAGLAGDEVDELGVTRTGGAVGVGVAGNAVTAKVSSTNGGDSAAEGVAGDNDTVAGVGSESGGDTSLCLGIDLIPGSGEAVVDLAVGSKVAILQAELDVGNPVEDVVASTDGNDNFLTSSVDADETSNAGEASPIHGVSQSIMERRLNGKCLLQRLRNGSSITLESWA